MERDVPSLQLPSLCSGDGAVPGKTFPRRMERWHSPGTIPSSVSLTSSQSVFIGNAMGNKGPSPPSQAWAPGSRAHESYAPLQLQQNTPSSHSHWLFSFPHTPKKRRTALGARAGVWTSRHGPKTWLETMQISIPPPRAGSRSLSMSSAQSPEDRGRGSTEAMCSKYKKYKMKIK